MSVNLLITASASRPLWRTVLGAGLLCLIPVVGWSMATIYVLTRNNPERYDAGEAANAGLLLLVAILVWWGGMFALFSAVALLIDALQ
jgi:hypothetical protein